MASLASNENPLPSCQIEQEQRQIETPPRDRGGYDCEFVERPKELETDCPICLQVLRDPFQTSCCGNSFCQSCINRVKDDEKACPTCNKVGFGVFPDKRLRKSLYAFQVRCTHQKSGCEWIGELGELDRHLNLNPELGKKLVGCAFATVVCTGPTVASTSSVAMCTLTKTSLAPSVLSAVTTARTIALCMKT